ncbi:hypothetical protein D6779_04965 [Candidatus Parcubacteria bacterium]|nr:MAG: hypothetical protein D6779_04965 [Candidatus Parcubacteria bacterium]
MTLEELFNFDQNDLRANRAGHLSPAQAAWWQKGLKRTRNVMQIGNWVIVLVIGATLLWFINYGMAFQTGVSPLVLIGGGLVLLIAPIFLFIKGKISASQKMQDTEEEITGWNVKHIEGKPQISRAFYEYYESPPGYEYTFSIDGQELQCNNPSLHGEEIGLALYGAFGLPQPPPQSKKEKKKHVPQITLVPDTYRAYYLDSWGQRYVCSIEKVSGAERYWAR